MQAGGTAGTTDIDPAEMRGFLPCTVLIDVERHATGLRFRYRLVGTQVVLLFGREVTGRYLDELNGDEIYWQVRDQLAGVVENARPASGQAVAPAVRRRRAMPYHHVTAPLAGDGSTVDMLLGVRCPLLLPQVARGRPAGEDFPRGYL